MTDPNNIFKSLIYQSQTNLLKYNIHEHKEICKYFVFFIKIEILFSNSENNYCKISF